MLEKQSPKRQKTGLRKVTVLVNIINGQKVVLRKFPLTTYTVTGDVNAALKRAYIEFPIPKGDGSMDVLYSFGKIEEI